MPEVVETKGAEEARSTLPALLQLAERGIPTIVSKHGRRVAAIVPIAVYDAYESSLRPRRLSPLSLVGSGHKLWGEDSTQTIRELRDEWSR